MAFKMRSGNTASFKKMGSSPYLKPDGEDQSGEKKFEQGTSSDSWNADFSQGEKTREIDREEGQKRRNYYNEKKARRKAEKSRKADAKAREASAKLDEARFGKDFEKIDTPKTKKEEREINKLSRKAGRKGQKARVKEALASRELSKKGREGGKPTKPKKEKKTTLLSGSRGVSRPGKQLKLDVVGTAKARKRDRESGAEDARKARNKAAKADFKRDRKAYRQGEGLRGNINVRRKAKGKDAI